MPTEFFICKFFSYLSTSDLPRTEPDGGRKWLMAYAPTGAKGIYIYVCATVARFTNWRFTQFVDKVGSTVFHHDLF